ncbi:MAG: Na+/H+ antiporter NhaC family protein, partial [Eggerthellales bacterium]|nr:Na+/H+ antiporter NhaC family protein [Eggerthellales bacterium]
MNTAWALLPPIVAIVLALITKETYTSLFVGIVIGAILVSISLTGGVDPITTLNCMISGTAADGESTVGLIPAVTDNAGIFVFLVMLGIMVALVNAAGGAAAFGAWAAKHIKGR